MMLTAEEHADVAEGLLDEATQWRVSSSGPSEHAEALLAEAQVHATLAVARATMEGWSR